MRQDDEWKRGKQLLIENFITMLILWIGLIALLLIGFGTFGSR